MNDKSEFIKFYFKDLHQSLSKCKSLLAQKDYYLEAILLLSCYIGAFSSLRYPDIKFDGEKYKKIVLDYSGMKDLYEEIDLLFFYQWSKSDFQNHGEYKKLKDYSDIVAILEKKYGDTDKVKEGTRYISQREFIDYVLSQSSSLDSNNLRTYLPLFSLAEILYRYLRCYAVHNVLFPFVNKGQTDDGSITYEDNHKITSDIIMKTAENILNNLKKECLDSGKWPHEL
jgi:hypothetical protein